MTDIYGDKYTDEGFTRKFLNRRIEDVETIIAYIKSTSIQNFHSIDMGKLVAMGHSMGGMTAIEM